MCKNVYLVRRLIRICMCLWETIGQWRRSVCQFWNYKTVLVLIWCRHTYKEENFINPFMVHSSLLCVWHTIFFAKYNFYFYELHHYFSTRLLILNFKISFTWLRGMKIIVNILNIWAMKFNSMDFIFGYIVYVNWKKLWVKQQISFPFLEALELSFSNLRISHPVCVLYMHMAHTVKMNERRR